MLMRFPKNTLAAVRRHRSKNTVLCDYGTLRDAALLIPSVRGTAWEVTLRGDAVLMARRVDHAKWLDGNPVVCDEGRYFTKRVSSTCSPKVLARGVHSLLRDKCVEVAP